MRWPWTRRETAAHPETETRSFLPVSDNYITARRADLLRDGAVPLSATVAACVGAWSRAFGQLDPSPDPNELDAATLSQIGADLLLRGQSVWHVSVTGTALALRRAATWDVRDGGRFVLSIPHPGGVETVRALDGEVLNLRVNPPVAAPWQGRSPLAFAGSSPALLAEIEAAISAALPWVGSGLLPFPDTVPAEQQSAAIQGLKAGGKLAAIRSKEDFTANTGAGRASEFRRIELTPDIEKAALGPVLDSLHARVLGAAGIPPGLFASSGNAGAAREAYRAFVLNTVAPTGRALLPELAKIGVTSLGTTSMLAADVSGRARAVSSLVQSGMELERALALVGWQDG